MMVPPMNAFPVMPAPPKTVNAPVIVLAEFVKLVTANPDTVTKPVDGFTTKEVTVDKPTPETFAPLTVVMKNDALLVDAIAATEEAAAGGTACQDGTAPEPLEVNT